MRSSTARHRRRILIPTPDLGESTYLGEKLRSETVGGALALVAAAAALLWANLAGGSYEALRHFTVGPLDVEHWAADGALTVFFFVAGIELKREFVLGSLRRPADAVVPVVAASCGVAVPAVVFLAINHGTGNLGGWAIPSATDIAFALAVLAVVGSDLPTQLRAFLLTLAVVDDLIVIVIIAVAYSEALHLAYLAAAVVLCLLYALCQRARLRTGLVYVPLAAATWWCVHSSGVHATIAGVALGLLTRAVPDRDESRSPVVRLSHTLGPWSAGVVVPLFALMSAGVRVGSESGLSGKPVFWGVLAGLVLGKPLGVLGGTWLLTRFTRADLGPVAWRDLLGVGILAGVGFTVSLLVADLSFADVRRTEAKTAVLLASCVAGALGALVLRRRNRFHAGS